MVLEMRRVWGRLGASGGCDWVTGGTDDHLGITLQQQQKQQQHLEKDTARAGCVGVCGMNGATSPHLA